MTHAKTKGTIQDYWPFLALFLVAAFLRFFKLAYPFAENGTDEGIQLMAAKLSAAGFTMYSQINTLQGPLFLFIYSLFNGDILWCRILSALFSLSGLLGVLLIGKRIANNSVSILAGVFVAFNFIYFQESRLASLDMFSTVLLIWGVYFTLLYILQEKPLRMHLLLSGLFFALAVMTKLYAVIPLGAISLYLLVLWLGKLKNNEYDSTKRFIDLIGFAAVIVVATLGIMSIYGIENTFRGIFLNQLYRPDQAFSYKLKMFAHYFGTTFVPFLFTYSPIVKSSYKAEVKVLLLWLAPLLIVFMFQATTWAHHYTFIVPPICILGALGIYHYLYAEEHLERIFPRLTAFSKQKKVVYSMIAVYLVVYIISKFFLVLPVKRPLEYKVANELKSRTVPSDYVISGDPLLPNYAGLLQVPEVANLAMVKYPPVTSDRLIDLLERYKVKAVILTYHLASNADFANYIKNNYDFYKAFDEKGKSYAHQRDIEISKENFNIYLRPLP